MKYLGVSSSEQVRRGYWRVTLKGDALDLAFLFSNPLEKWPAKVERWRAAVNAGKAEIAASCSSASTTADEGLLTLTGARAVVDVHVLGADEGDTVGNVARRMDSLIGNVDVESVQAVNNADPIARDAALQTAEQDAKEASDVLGLDKVYDVLKVVLIVGLIVGAVYVLSKGREILK